MEVPSSPQRATSIVHHLFWVLLASIQDCCANVFIYDSDPNSNIDGFSNNLVIRLLAWSSEIFVPSWQCPIRWRDPPRKPSSFAIASSQY